MPVSPSNNLLMIGHSLVGQDIPKMVESQNSDLGHTGDVDYQVIIGAPLRISWNDHDQPHAQGVDSRAALATGEYGAVVMTEAVPLETNVEWNDTSGFALNFHNLAYENNPDVQTYFYETWHGFDFFDGDLAAWRASLDDYLPMWEGVVNEVNANRAPGSKEMLLVPGGQAMAQIYDAIEAGELPGYTSIRDIFTDDIHPTKEGEQLIAALTTSVVYGHDPADLSDTTTGEFGPFPAPSPAMAEMIKTIVYRTVDEYDRDGIDASEFRAPGDPVDPVDPPVEEPQEPVDPVDPEEPPVDPEEPSVPEEPEEPAPVDPTPTNPEDPDDEGEEPQNGDTAAGGACFVATAAYGDRMAEPVVALRHFRDHHLVNSLAGRAFVRAYWVVGPKLAERVRPESAAGRTSRFVLDRMVTVLRRAGLTGGQ